MNNEKEPASEAKERIEREAIDASYNIDDPSERQAFYFGYIAGATAEYNRAQEEITRLKAELEKAKDELQLAKFDYKAMFDEVKRLRSLLSEFEKMKAELERERENTIDICIKEIQSMIKISAFDEYKFSYQLVIENIERLKNQKIDYGKT